MALRPRASAAAISSRYGSQALAAGLRPGARRRARSRSTPLLAGFAAAAAAESVDTLDWPVLAAARGCRGGRTAMPAAFKYALAVSRRTPVASSMRRSDQPSRPSAITCCRFSALKTLAIPAVGAQPTACVNVSTPAPLGRFSGVDHWPVLGVDRGRAACDALRDPIGDFPFVDDASRANSLALMLTPILRQAIPGPVPLALIDKPKRGTGGVALRSTHRSRRYREDNGPHDGAPR